MPGRDAFSISVLCFYSGFLAELRQQLFLSDASGSSVFAWFTIPMEWVTMFIPGAPGAEWDFLSPAASSLCQLFWHQVHPLSVEASSAPVLPWYLLLVSGEVTWCQQGNVGRRRCLGWNKASQKATKVKNRTAGEETSRVAGSGTRKGGWDSAWGGVEAGM